MTKFDFMTGIKQMLAKNLAENPKRYSQFLEQLNSGDLRDGYPGDLKSQKELIDRCMLEVYTDDILEEIVQTCPCGREYLMPKYDFDHIIFRSDNLQEVFDNLPKEGPI